MPSVSGFDPDTDEAYGGDRPAGKVSCRHCFVWSEVRDGEMAILCGHGCGLVKHSWLSTDIVRERLLAEESQANFRYVHLKGCPSRKRRESSSRSSRLPRTARNRRGG